MTKFNLAAWGLAVLLMTPAVTQAQMTPAVPQAPTTPAVVQTPTTPIVPQAPTPPAVVPTQKNPAAAPAQKNPAAAPGQMTDNQVFDAVYESCMRQSGADDGGSLQQKEPYCSCLRNQVARNRDLGELARSAAEHQVGGVNESNLRKIEAMAQDCVKKPVVIPPR
jgi:hypothetical protein